MKRFNNYIQELFDNAKVISFSKIPFSSEVRKLCEQNMCGNFGKSWTCPPAVESPEELQNQLSHFNQVMIVNKIYKLSDSFDWEGMKRGAEDFQSKILKLKIRIRKSDPDFLFIALGAGICRICEICTYEKKLPCRNPLDAIVSVEACGIDVMDMLKQTELTYNNGPNTVTYVGAVFFQPTSDSC
jgi:predicted metal-binding protein